MFLFNRCVAATQADTVHPMFGLGYSDATNNVVSIAGSLSGQSTMSTRRWQSTVKCIGGYNGAGSIDIQASLDSLDSDGFTVNYSNVEASAYEVTYLAIGGVTEKVGTTTYPLTTGPRILDNTINNKAVFVHGIAATAGGFATELFNMGMGVSPAARSSLGATDANGGSTSSAKQNTDTSDIFTARNTGSPGSVLAQADLVVINPTRVVLNFTTVSGNPDLVPYMLLGQTGPFDSSLTTPVSDGVAYADDAFSF
jgi:hypothetical protein